MGSFSVFGRHLSVLDIFLFGLISCVLLLQLHLQCVQKINWDEFFYLSHIYDAQAGRLSKTLQMGHVYLFGWLTLIPGGEINQITVGRVAMWLIQCATIYFTVRTALKFMSLTGAMFTGLSFLCVGFVFVHGTSFRADPIAALCMMYGVYVFAASNLTVRDLAALAVALALGVFCTIKVILFAPLFLVLAIWRLRQAESFKSVFLKFCTTIIAAIILCGMALMLHAGTLQSENTVTSSNSLAGTFKTVFLSGGLFPRAAIMKVGFITGALPTLMMILGACIALGMALRAKANRETYLIVLSLLIPLLSFVFYRNAYPYFYGFIIPSSMILAGFAIHHLKLSKIIIALISGLMAFNMVIIYIGRLDETRNVQTQTLDAIHEIFPEPVNYFDRNGMIASFPKAGLFMSSWGLRNYKMDGQPRFLNEMKAKTVPLLINNSPAISSALKAEATPLMAIDAAALRDNYIPHWGHIWVAGKTFDVTPNEMVFTVTVPGTYTLETDAPVTVNARIYHPGDDITLGRGDNTISSLEKTKITLRWGKDLMRPENVPSDIPIFGAF